MSTWRIILIIPAGCLIWALVWLLWPLASSFSQAAPAGEMSPQHMAADERSSLRTSPGPQDAAQLVNSALERLQSPNASCLETTIWQRGTLGDVTFEAEGRYLSAPRGRIRIDLETHAGDARGRIRIISDGT